MADESLEKYFDESFYVQNNSDVKDFGVSPFDHFMNIGWKEGRNPNENFSIRFYLDTHIDVAESGINPFVHYYNYGINEERLVSSVNYTSEAAFKEVLKRNFDKNYYLQNNPDVAASQIDPLEHFLQFGWKEGRGPSENFSIKSYLSNFVVNDSCDLSEGKKNIIKKRFYAKEDVERVQMNFDADFYYRCNSDVLASKDESFEHFMDIGWAEGRDPNENFSCYYYLKNNKDIAKANVNPYLHYLKAGCKEKWRKHCCSESGSVFKRFDSGLLAKAVADAIDLEPLVGHPVDTRSVRIPFNKSNGFYKCIKFLRKSFSGIVFDYVVILPHIRMSGAARVASKFVNTLCTIVPAEKILVLLTDGPETDYCEWFPSNVLLFNLHDAYTNHDCYNEREQIFLDIIYGVEAKFLININSRIFWDCLKNYALQLSQDFNIITYLFTWDLNKDGVRVGYPVTWLRYSIDYIQTIFCDSEALCREIRGRFALSEKQVLLARTPIASVPQCLVKLKGWSESMTALAGKVERPRVLWAGRLDRQKRPDILVQIAKQNPHIDFDVYGKPVLDKELFKSLKELPNICLKGTYRFFHELQFNEYSCYLYTSQWDGLPTILLDVAQMRLPIVASSVGGVPELINSETGWLIDPFDDISLYSEMINYVVQNPDIAYARAIHLEKEVLRLHSKEKYRETLMEVF